MEDIDWKKLAKQEPEFVDYVKSVMWQSIALQNPDLLKALHSFYQIGTSVEDVVRWMKFNQPPPETKKHES